MSSSNILRHNHFDLAYRYLIILTVIICTAACVSPTRPEPKIDDYPSVARVAPVPLAQLNPRQKEVLGIVDGEPVPKRANLKILRTLMHNPELFAVYDPMAQNINRAPQITSRQRELVTLRVSWLYKGKYEWSQHYPRGNYGL